MDSASILIVEDDLITANEIESSLQAAGYTTLGIATSGEEAVEMADSLGPDIIIMDIVLQGTVDGIEAVRRIQQHRKVPIIYLTASSTPGTFQQARETDLYGFLVKPIRQADLIIAIDTALKRSRLEKKLRDSEELWKNTFDAVPDLIAIIGIDHKIVRANRAMAQKFGKTADEIVGEFCYELIHGASEPPPFCHNESMLLNGGGHMSEIHEERLGGDFLLSVSPLRNNADRIIGSVHVARDINDLKKAEASLRDANELLEHRVRERTERMDKIIERLASEIEERKKTEEALRRNELKFRTVSDFTYDWEYWIDQTGRIVYVSPSCERITGYGPEEFMKDSNLLVRIIHPEDRDQYILHAQAEFVTREQHAIGFTIIRKDGNHRRIAHACTPVYDETGGFAGRRVSNRDVTLQRITEIKLREGEEVARALINTSSEPVLLVNADATIADANDEFALRHNRPRSDIVGMSLLEFLDGGRSSLRYKKMVEVLETGAAMRFEEQSGTSWYDTIIYPVPDHRGRITKLAIFLHDITDTRRMQKEIMEISELERQRIGQDLHDGLGQKLTGIAFLTEALKRTMSEKGYPELADVDEIMENIAESIDHARKISSGLWTARLEAYDIEDALQELAEDSETLFDITCTLASDLKHEISNSMAVANLYYITRESINNAIKHGKADRITIRLNDDRERIYLEVEDNGRGAQQNFLESKGIGLRIMQYRADIIGGTLSIKNSTSGFTVQVSIKKEFIDEFL